MPQATLNRPIMSDPFEKMLSCTMMDDFENTKIVGQFWKQFELEIFGRYSNIDDHVLIRTINNQTLILMQKIEYTRYENGSVSAGIREEPVKLSELETVDPTLFS